MDFDARKTLGFLLVILETILVSCLSILSFFYSVWPLSSSFAEKATENDWVIQEFKRGVVVLMISFFSSFLLHTANKIWIQKTGYGKISSSRIFSLISGILILFSGMAGLLYFSIEKPVI